MAKSSPSTGSPPTPPTPSPRRRPSRRRTRSSRPRRPAPIPNAYPTLTLILTLILTPSPTLTLTLPLPLTLARSSRPRRPAPRVEGRAGVVNSGDNRAPPCRAASRARALRWLSPLGTSVRWTSPSPCHHPHGGRGEAPPPSPRRAQATEPVHLDRSRCIWARSRRNLPSRDRARCCVSLILTLSLTLTLTLTLSLTLTLTVTLTLTRRCVSSSRRLIPSWLSERAPLGVSQG